MAGKREFDIGEGIKKLRDLRIRFAIDTHADAYENAEKLVDRLWPLQAAQIGPVQDVSAHLRARTEG